MGFPFFADKIQYAITKTLNEGKVLKDNTSINFLEKK
jgi:hypothetical protein